MKSKLEKILFDINAHEEKDFGDLIEERLDKVFQKYVDKIDYSYIKASDMELSSLIKELSK